MTDSWFILQWSSELQCRYIVEWLGLKIMTWVIVIILQAQQNSLSGTHKTIQVIIINVPNYETVPILT